MKTLQNLSIPQKLGLAFAGLLAVVVACSGIGLAQIRHLEAASRWTLHTLEVLETASAVRAAMVDQQSGLRGYLEGGRPEFLEPFRQGRAQTDGLLDGLRRLTADNPGQQDRIAATDQAIRRWYADYADVRFAANGRLEDDALALIGKARMDKVKRLIAEIVAEERRLLVQRSADEAQAFRTAYWATGLGGVCLLLVAVAVWAALRQGIAVPIRSLTGLVLRLADDRTDLQVPWRDRKDEVGALARGLEVFRLHAADRHRLEAEKAAADARVRANEERLQNIFDSVREGILTCGPDGGVQSANGAAGRLFGHDDLTGLPVGVLLADPADAERRLDPAALAADGAGTTVETVGRRADGAEFAAEVSLSRSANGQVTLSVRDIAARKEVERMKGEFVSTVSHELRTPLTSIRGALGLVLGMASGVPEKTLSLLQIAHRNAERLIALVNDILDMEKIQSGKMEFAMARLDLQAGVQEAVEANLTYAGQRRVDLRYVAWIDPVTVVADGQRLQQVLANLLSNAVKFSDEGGTVTVRVAVAGEGKDAVARVSVHDTGPGVPEAFKGRIFQKFAQADGADTRAKGGTGLGLSITKAIVERHGGEVGFVSEPGDTTFFVTLPLAPEQAPAGVPVASHCPTPALGGRLLICEDDPDIARLLRFMVERQGIDADIVHTAAAARDALELGCYAAMTLDLGLQDEHGLSLFRSLRADPRFRDLPIVVISATAEQGKQELNGEALGIVDWLEKPIDERRLARVLGDVLDRGGDLPHILHVEDDADLAELLRRLLADRALVVGAPDLAGARAHLARQRFDLVVLDLGLGPESGLDLLPEIAAKEPAPPVLVFSAQQVGPAFADRVAGALVKSRTTNDELVRRILDVVTQAKRAERA